MALPILMTLLKVLLDLNPAEGVECSMKPPIDLKATNEKQILTSPGYPLSYGNLQKCVWRIETSVDYEVIRLKILDFHIRNSATCSEDYVEVRDGRNHWDRLVQTWCGYNAVDGELTSSEQAVYVTFKSDVEFVDKGFKINYWSVPKDRTEYTPPEYSPLHFILMGVSGFLFASIIFSAIIIAMVRTGRKVKKKSREAAAEKNKKLTTRGQDLHIGRQLESHRGSFSDTKSVRRSPSLVTLTTPV